MVKKMVKRYCGHAVRAYRRVRHEIREYKKRRDWRNRLHMVYIPSYRCNYRCPYCDVWKLDKKFPEQPVTDWLQFFNELPKTIIDVTGGEPFIYPEWRRLLNEMPDKHRVSATTNLSYEPREYRDLWTRLAGITLSYHPHTADLADFTRKMNYVEKINPNLSVNIVAYPDQLDRIQGYIDEIQGKQGIPVNIDPYIAEEYSYTDEEARKVRELRGMAERSPDRRIGYQAEDENRLKLCDAGIQHFLVVPDGSAFTCMCGYFQNPDDHYIGNVLDPDWKPRQTRIPCRSSCSCGCDLDWIHYEVIKE